MLIGLSPAGEKAEVELPRLFAKRARILTSHGGDHLPQEDFPRLAQWALEGKLDLAGMVTRRIGLDDAPRALDELKSSPDLIRSVDRASNSARGPARQSGRGRLPRSASARGSPTICPPSPGREWSRKLFDAGFAG